MSTTAIRLADAQILVLAKVLDSLHAVDLDGLTVELSEYEHDELERTRQKITTAASDIVHAETASRRRTPEPPVDRALAFFAEAMAELEEVEPAWYCRHCDSWIDLEGRSAHQTEGEHLSEKHD